ncbi:E3 ubiquitin-protein ligase CIP8-like [Quercus lobata]|uniref:E3 ubiquitin-protein ligase CIP8-like n=1 Tax=Quercus lobata TaxID=97700 RepID=UPI001245D3DB|nr:E3 ubiquitin-protein ligase CIP8-like [Quercus lobata]
MIPNFSPSLSYGQFNDEPTNHGRLSELSSSTLPSLSILFSDDHEHERNNRRLLSDHGVSFSPSRLPSSSSHLFNEGEASFLSSLLPSILSSSFSHHEREPADRGWLSDRGASFSSSRLPSSFSRFSDDVSSDDDEHAPPNLFDHDHVPSRFNDDREHVSSDDDEHAPPSLFDHEHIPSRLHELSLSSDDDEHVPSQFSDDHEHEPTYHGSVSPNFSLFDNKEDASTSANDKLIENGSFVVGSSQQKQGFDVGFYCSICLEEPQAGDKLIRMNCSHIYHQYCLLPWLQMHNTCPNCRSKLDQQ